MNKQETIQKLRDWLLRNRLALLYPILAVIIEMTAVFAVEGNPFFNRPFLFLGLVIMLTGVILLFKDNRARLAIGTFWLAIQAIVDLIFAVIYDMTGQYFDLGMLKLRNDAVAILESIPINFFTFYAGVTCCVIYMIYGLRSLREENGKKVKRGKYSAWYYAALIAAGVATSFGSFLVYYPAKTDKYQEMVYGKVGSVYSAYGLIGNLMGEIGNTFKEDKTTITKEQAEEFLYAQTSTPTKYFGASKDKNVVMILSESFEWYAFMRSDAFPNALDFTDEELAELYPNLTKMYNESVILTNFHSREKTDASETISLLGSYPTDASVNYDYPANAIAHTVPNILKLLDPDIQNLSFHNGEKTYYNRYLVHKAFGFEYLTDMYDMAKMSEETVKAGGEPTFINHNKENDELNLDSEMIATCKDMMFPTDKRFYTYITSITMHGTYYDRENLQTEYDQVSAVLGDRVPDPEKDEEAYFLFNYMVTAKEFDDALGVLRQDLEAKGLTDKTLIVLFGDHNAYYNQLSNYVKDIENENVKDKIATDLYKVPLMIYDSSLEHQTVDKFTCTSDIAPTVLDLLGINYFTNMYYGTSVFNDEVSVLYSRGYDIFLRNGIISRSVKNILYSYYTADPVRSDKEIDRYMPQETYAAMMNSFDTAAQNLVEKIKYCDYIFKKDYFGNAGNFAQYKGRMLTINGK